MGTSTKLELNVIYESESGDGFGYYRNYPVTWITIDGEKQVDHHPIVGTEIQVNPIIAWVLSRGKNSPRIGRPSNKNCWWEYRGK